MSGKSPFPYIPAFNASLFLSANESDVKAAIESGYPAGVVLQTKAKDDKHDKALRVAFDFDGVLADDEAETVFQKTGNLKKYHASEIKKHGIALKPGPLNDLFTKLASIREIEIKRSQEDPSYKRIIRTAIVTARGAPAHERLVETLRKWGVTVDETFFLGGIDKIRILEIMKPHIYFDDQMTHLKSAAKNIPSVHIPFGIANKPKKSKGRKRS
jgi:5'-nucleotidase